MANHLLKIIISKRCMYINDKLTSAQRCSLQPTLLVWARDSKSLHISPFWIRLCWLGGFLQLWKDGRWRRRFTQSVKVLHLIADGKMTDFKKRIYNLNCFAKFTSLFRSVGQANWAKKKREKILTSDVITIIRCQVHQHSFQTWQIDMSSFFYSAFYFESERPGEGERSSQTFEDCFGNVTCHTAQTSSELFIFTSSTSVTSWFSNSTAAASTGNKPFPSLWPSTCSFSLFFSVTDN